jgi:uncharacterized delta-60 repeat protein
MRWERVIVAVLAACGGSSAAPDAGGKMCAPGLPGAIDPCFGSDGVTQTTTPNDQQTIHELLIDADGRIIAVGVVKDASSQFHIALARYSADGVLDESVGGGLVITELAPGSTGTSPAGAVLAGDGGVVIAAVAGAGDQFTLVRFAPDGRLDTAFGSGGIVTIGQPGTYAKGLTALPDGKLLAVARTGASTVVLARLTSTGSLDASFGNAGIVMDAVPLMRFDVTAMVADAGSIVLAGRGETSSNGPSHPTIARYSAAGVRDTAFGTDGVVVATDFAQGQLDSTALGFLARSAGGGCVAGGFHTWSPPDGTSPMEVIALRVDASGALDATFATGGVFRSTFGEAKAAAHHGLLAADDELVLVGNSQRGADEYAASLFRLTAAGAPDPAWADGTGHARAVFGPLSGAGGHFRAIARDAQGRYVVAGAVGSSWLLSRYWP